MPPRPRHALITGGSRGIGLSIAQLFAQNSIRCTLLSRTEETLKSAVSTLKPLPNNAYSHGHIAGSGQTIWNPKSGKGPNFSDILPNPKSNDHDDPSRIDILVNCAGISQAASFLRFGAEDVEQLINTNLTSLIIGTRYLMRNGYLKDKEGKRATKLDSTKSQTPPSPVIINISSLLALKSGFGATSYAASKAGILGFTRALATEYTSHRVRVNAIVPGYINTDMTSNLNDKELTRQIPLGRFGTPEEVAQAALFLVQNEYAHNCVVNLDGGLSAV